MSLPERTYDEKDLQLFLRAHVMAAGALATNLPPAMRDTDRDRLNAEKGERARLRKVAFVSADVFRLAWAGRPVMPEHRRRLWLAMGIDPHVGETRT